MRVFSQQNMRVVLALFVLCIIGVNGVGQDPEVDVEKTDVQANQPAEPLPAVAPEDQAAKDPVKEKESDEGGAKAPKEPQEFADISDKEAEKVIDLLFNGGVDHQEEGAPQSNGVVVLENINLMGENANDGLGSEWIVVGGDMMAPSSDNMVPQGADVMPQEGNFVPQGEDMMPFGADMFPLGINMIPLGMDIIPLDLLDQGGDMMSHGDVRRPHGGDDEEAPLSFTSVSNVYYFITGGDKDQPTDNDSVFSFFFTFFVLVTLVVCIYYLLSKMCERKHYVNRSTNLEAFPAYTDNKKAVLEAVHIRQ